MTVPQLTMKKLIISLLVSLSGISFLQAQNDTVWTVPPEITFSSFVDIFYVYDFNKPQGNSRQAFFFHHNRHNEFNLNLGLLKTSIKHEKYRGNFALQAGTYAHDNYSSEDDVMKNIFEANVGIALNQKNSLWLDAGIFGSHLGFESPLSIDNPTLTRSLAAESSPYFLTGVKVSYTPNQYWELVALIINGWQRIQKVAGNSIPSFGSQITYSPSANTMLNWSTFIGTDDPDSTRRVRYFSNLYGQFQLSKTFHLTVGFDVGIQQRSKGSGSYDTWYTPVVIGQLVINRNWKTAIRAEYYQDQAGVIVANVEENSFETGSFSLNFDYSPSPYLMWRIEGRWLYNKQPFFETDGELSKNNTFIGTSIAFKFGQEIR